MTLTLPLDELSATTAEITESDKIRKLAAGKPPKRTTTTSVKFAPVIVATVPLRAVVGEKLVIVGAGTNVKPFSEAVPPIVAIETLPVAPVPTIARISVGETTLKLAAVVPAKRTSRTVARFVPVIVISCRMPAFWGEKFVILGAGTNV